LDVIEFHQKFNSEAGKVAETIPFYSLSTRRPSEESYQLEFSEGADIRPAKESVIPSGGASPEVVFEGSKIRQT